MSNEVTNQKPTEDARRPIHKQLVMRKPERDITDEFLDDKELLTHEYVEAWKDMGISKDWQIKRISEWAAMLEKRLAQLDSNYRTYPFGRIDA